jgi:hypothetical protein
LRLLADWGDHFGEFDTVTSRIAELRGRTTR